jgi:NAD+ diphosphatase
MSNFFDRILERDKRPAFLGNPIERWSEARAGLDIAAALAGADATIYLFDEDRPLVTRTNGSAGAAFAPDAARALGLVEESLILLGVVGAAPRFAGLVTAGTALPADVSTTDLRSLAIEGALAAPDLAALAQARSYLHWHAANRFCGRCGNTLAAKGGGTSRVCPSCGNEVFPRVDPVVIMVAIDGQRCLLGRQARFAPGMYSALAGFLEPGETIEEAVRREVKEESGIRIGRVAYHSSQPWPFASSLMIGCHAEALSTEIDRDAEELEDCRWFDRAEVRQMLAGEHPQNLKAPMPMAIAHHLLRAFAEG